MFRVFLMNVGNELGTFGTFQEAREKAISSGFEATVAEVIDPALNEEEIVGWFSPIGGFHYVIR